jgi:hypothetical protein
VSFAVRRGEVSQKQKTKTQSCFSRFLFLTLFRRIKYYAKDIRSAWSERRRQDDGALDARQRPHLGMNQMLGKVVDFVIICGNHLTIDRMKTVERG